MATSWQRVAHSVIQMFYLYFACVYIEILVVFYFDFENKTFVLIAQVPGHCLCLTFQADTSRTENRQVEKLLRGRINRTGGGAI